MKHFRLFAILIAMCAGFVSSAYGQGRTVTGTVYDSKEQPLIGVSVVLVGTTTGTSTDLDGNFSLNVPNSAANLEFSYMGYVTKTMQVPTTQTSVKVFMTEDAVDMESVVVVGYGTQKKVNLIGAVNQVDAEALQDRVAPTVAHMLQGTVPGLNITTSSGRPGNTAAVNIRGVTSINGGSPLILIDGAEGDLTRINSNDVESISVIKDASAAAIYGARAAYGVILVTTKSGKEGKTSINYSGRFGWNENTTSTEYESRGYYSVYINNLFWRNDSGTTNYANYTDQDMEMLWERRNDKTEHPDRPWVIQEKRNGKDVYSMYANTDWYHWLYQDKRPMMNHALSITGGNDKVRYMVSGNIYNEEGMFRKNPDNLQRLNFRSKLDFNVTDWFKITNNTSFYSQKYSYPGVSGAETSFSLMTVHALASYVPILPDGGSLYKTQYNTYTIMDGMVVYMEKDGHRNVDKNQAFTNTTEFTLTPVKGLSIVGNFTYKMNNNRTMNRVVNGSYSESPGNIVNITTGSYFKDKLYETYSNHDYYQVNLFATYENTFGKHHNFKAMAGYNYETKYLKDIKSTGYHSFSETLDDFNLLGTKDDGEKELALSGGQNEYALMGYFARLNYDYKGKYLVELSGRYDGTSRFARGQRWGFFPSASVGWRVSEEGFFEPIKGWFNNLKIRYSHGQLGNQNVGYYDYIQKISFALQSYYFGGNKSTAATIGAPVSDKLTWETSVQNNFGIDASFFNNRLSLTADYYIRDTKDMLTEGVALPAVYGASAPKTNTADLRTKGYEIMASWRDSFDLGGKPFTYGVTATFNDYKSEITKYDNPGRTFAKSYYVGQTWGEIWGYHTDGLFRSNEEAQEWAAQVDQKYVNDRIYSRNGELRGLRGGDLKYLDLNDNGKIDIGKNTVDDPGDRRIIGNTQPRYMYGLNLNLGWQGIDFSIFFQGVGQQHWYPEANTLAFWGPYARPYATLIPKDFHTMYWTEENPDAYFPYPRGYIALSSNRSLTTKNTDYLQDIGYLRLKNLTVGYTLPQKWTNKVFIQKLRVYFSGENLHFWANDLHSDYIDPEQAAATATGAASSTLRTYSWPRTYTFGIDITF